MAYKTGNCIENYDNSGASYGYISIGCDSTGAVVTLYSDYCYNSIGAYYLPTDTCTGGTVFTCEADTGFLQRWKDSAVLISYGNYSDAYYNNVLAADSFTAVSESDFSANTISNLNPWDRSTCNWWMIPNNYNCIDTSNSKSYADVPKGFNYGTVNFYSRFEGEGTATSYDYYLSDYYYAGWYSYITPRYFTKGWYENYVGGANVYSAQAKTNSKSTNSAIVTGAARYA
jgi:hypothetical protein